MTLKQNKSAAVKVQTSLAVNYEVETDKPTAKTFCFVFVHLRSILNKLNCQIVELGNKWCEMFLHHSFAYLRDLPAELET